MFKEIVFFNYCGNGDIHVSRSFVNFIINNIECKKYTYRSYRDTLNILKDIEKLTHENIENVKNWNPGWRSKWYLDDGIFFINTHYCAFDSLFQKGTTISTLYNVFSYGLKKNTDLILDNIIKYIPEINFEKYNLKKIDNFINLNKNKKKVFFVSSNYGIESYNFNWSNIVNYLSIKYKDILFILSDYIDLTFEIKSRNNVFFSRDISGITNTDLNESAYLANNCDVIIGKGSGLHTFTLNIDTIIKKPVIRITVSPYQDSGEFGIPDIYPNIKNYFFWTNSVDINYLAKYIEEKINYTNEK